VVEALKNRMINLEAQQNITSQERDDAIRDKELISAETQKLRDEIIELNKFN
jgi:hypothetical protein